MPFIYLISMLDKKGIFFPRGNLLGDPFEGSVTKINKRAEYYFFTEKFMKDTPKEHVQITLDAMAKNRQDFVRQNFISCWHMNEHESAAMWEIYGKFEVSIALKSTYQRLSDSLPKEAHIGVVNYIDYASGIIDAKNSFNFIMNKMKSFEHERELRAVIWEKGSSFIGSGQESGLWIDVELGDLIEGIYISPKAPLWILDLIKNVVSRYGFEGKLPVHQSLLGKDPIW